MERQMKKLQQDVAGSEDKPICKLAECIERDLNNQVNSNTSSGAYVGAELTATSLVLPMQNFAPAASAQCLPFCNHTSREIVRNGLLRSRRSKPRTSIKLLLLIL